MARSHDREMPTDRDLDTAYRQVVLPAKLRLDARYLSERGVGTDIAVIAATLGLRQGPSGELAPRQTGEHSEH